MKFFIVLACVFALPAIAFAADHGPVFSYATPVNSTGEWSFDTGIFGRSGSLGTELSTGSGFGYGLTPHLTLNAFLPATFGSGSLPESRMISGSEWSAGASWRFLHSVTSVGKRIESTASLAVVVPGPQQDSGVLAGLHRAPGIAGTIATGFASRSQYVWVVEAIHVLLRVPSAVVQTPSPGAGFMAIVRCGCAGDPISGTTVASQS